MDQHIADLLGINLDDPAVRRESAAIERDMQLIEALVTTRKQLGLSQSDVASRMGRSQPSVSDFERIGEIHIFPRFAGTPWPSEPKFATRSA